MPVPVSVVIPTLNRTDRLGETLEQISACDPEPSEILVHADAGDNETIPFLQARWPHVRVLESKFPVGPGGGRNKLIEAAEHEIVASFDDDSYPIDDDYFARLIEVFSMFPEADLIAATELTRDDSVRRASREARWTCTFVGCACAYRRSAFMDTQGYLELPEFYGAEEQDLALQFSGEGRRILQSDWLRVFHDTEYENRDAEARAIWIANTALLVALRYPVSLFWYGVLQVLNAMKFAAWKGRPRAIARALCKIPKKIWRHRHKRTPLPVPAVLRYLQLRSAPEPASFPKGEEKWTDAYSTRRIRP